MSGAGPALAVAGYAALLWGVALALDAVGRRSSPDRLRGPGEEAALRSDVARFHAAIAGAVLAAAAFLLVAFAIAQRDPPALLLLPLAVASAAGARRRIAPILRAP